jgi:hypothetical protein
LKGLYENVEGKHGFTGGKRKEKKDVDDTMKVQRLHVLHIKKEEAETNRKAR